MGVLLSVIMGCVLYCWVLRVIVVSVDFVGEIVLRRATDPVCQCNLVGGRRRCVGPSVVRSW